MKRELGGKRNYPLGRWYGVEETATLFLSVLPVCGKRNRATGSCPAIRPSLTGTIAAKNGLCAFWGEGLRERAKHMKGHPHRKKVVTGKDMESIASNRFAAQIVNRHGKLPSASGNTYWDRRQIVNGCNS